MTILYDCTRPVKSARSFGRGILPSVPSDRLPVPLSDLEWARVSLNEGSTDFEVLGMALEARAVESRALDSMELGLIPADVAEGIALTSLVGLRGEMADAYADEVQRISGRRPSRPEAAASVALAWSRNASGR